MQISSSVVNYGISKERSCLNNIYIDAFTYTPSLCSQTGKFDILTIFPKIQKEQSLFPLFVSMSFLAGNGLDLRYLSNNCDYGDSSTKTKQYENKVHFIYSISLFVIVAGTSRGIFKYCYVFIFIWPFTVSAIFSGNQTAKK